jgi:UDP-N-acetylmuramoyl-tripeptide--D-alanyl-D-alanine ligase
VSTQDERNGLPGPGGQSAGRASGSPIALSAADIARVSGGRVVAGDPARRFERVSIDSRTLQPGDLFFAIRGERFDGHDFVPAVVAAGASGVVVSRSGDVAGWGASAGANADAGGLVVIEVGDTTRALQLMAREVRRQSGARVIAITGSAGKTTTKEVTAEFLKLRYETFRNKGNLNNHIGLPLSLLELRDRPEMAVVELGMSAPGEIRTLVEVAEPDVRVWTNVGAAHLESFPSIDAIANAKAEVLEFATRDSCLVMNAADPRIVSRTRNFPGRTWTFAIDAPASPASLPAAGGTSTVQPASATSAVASGDASGEFTSPLADVRATDVREMGVDGVVARVETPAGSATLQSPLLGRANLNNVLAAICVALDAGVPLTDLVERARTLTPASHRGQVLRTAAGVTVLDDSYNANPLAVRRALEVIAADTHATRRIAVLGEMLELGPESAQLHEECGRAAVTARVDRLVTVGGAPARALGLAAVAAGLAPEAVSHVDDSTAAAAVVASLVRAGDLVLVKGSRGIRLERVVERLQGAST